MNLERSEEGKVILRVNGREINEYEDKRRHERGSVEVKGWKRGRRRVRENEKEENAGERDLGKISKQCDAE